MYVCMYATHIIRTVAVGVNMEERSISNQSIFESTQGHKREHATLLPKSEVACKQLSCFRRPVTC